LLWAARFHSNWARRFERNGGSGNMRMPRERRRNETSSPGLRSEGLKLPRRLSDGAKTVGGLLVAAGHQRGRAAHGQPPRLGKKPGPATFYLIEVSKDGRIRRTTPHDCDADGLVVRNQNKVTTRAGGFTAIDGAIAIW
jgi:hypothetical protein